MTPKCDCFTYNRSLYRREKREMNTANNNREGIWRKEWNERGSGNYSAILISIITTTSSLILSIFICKQSIWANCSNFVIFNNEIITTDHINMCSKRKKIVYSLSTGNALTHFWPSDSHNSITRSDKELKLTV
jgi:hypothetical protein